MEQINLRHPTIGVALRKLKDDIIKEHGMSHHVCSDQFGTLFEQKYNCIIVAADAYCTEGHLIFENDQYCSLFLLQFSGVPDANQHSE